MTERTDSPGVVQRSYPVLALFLSGAVAAGATNWQFAVLVGVLVFIGNAILKTTLGNEPLYVAQ